METAVRIEGKEGREGGREGERAEERNGVKLREREKKKGERIADGTLHVNEKKLYVHLHSFCPFL